MLAATIYHRAPEMSQVGCYVARWRKMDAQTRLISQLQHPWKEKAGRSGEGETVYAWDDVDSQVGCSVTRWRKMKEIDAQTRLMTELQHPWRERTGRSGEGETVYAWDDVRWRGKDAQTQLITELQHPWRGGREINQYMNCLCLRWWWWQSSIFSVEM